MKAVAVGFAWIAGSAQTLTDGFGTPMDRLVQFGVLAVLAAGLFGYAAWRWEAERNWRRTRRAA